MLPKAKFLYQMILANPIIEQWKKEGLKDVPTQPTSTGVLQQWGKPRGEKLEPEAVAEMVLHKPTNLSRKRKPITAKFIDNR